MPPRYVYWTILIDGKATAFRAHEQEELLPTLNQLKRKNGDVQLKYFARGKIWDSPEQAQWAGTNAGRPTEKRNYDWRPGGEHKDPRARFDKPKPNPREDVRPRIERRAAKFGAPRGESGAPPEGSHAPVLKQHLSSDAPPRPQSDRPLPRGDNQRGVRPPATGDRRPWSDKPPRREGGDRPWSDRPPRPQGDRPWSAKPPASGERRPWTDKPPRRDDRPPTSGDRPWSDRPPRREGGERSRKPGPPKR